MGTSRAMLSCSSTLMPGGAVDERGEGGSQRAPNVCGGVGGGLTVDAVQPPPGGRRLRGLRADALHFFGTEAQQQDEDEGDEEAGQQQDGHHDDLLLVHTDLCGADTRGRGGASPWFLW